MFNPTVWTVTQPLSLNNPIAGYVHILPSAGLYLTQHFLSLLNPVISTTEQLAKQKYVV